MLEPAGPLLAAAPLLAVSKSKSWGRGSSGDERGDRGPPKAACSVAVLSACTLGIVVSGTRVADASARADGHRRPRLALELYKFVLW